MFFYVMFLGNQEHPTVLQVHLLPEEDCKQTFKNNSVNYRADNLNTLKIMKFSWNRVCEVMMLKISKLLAMIPITSLHTTIFIRVKFGFI